MVHSHSKNHLPTFRERRAKAISSRKLAKIQRTSNHLTEYSVNQNFDPKNESSFKTIISGTDGHQSLCFPRRHTVLASNEVNLLRYFT